MYTETKTCLACESLIKGRVDKKFCNDHCRNTFNNRLNSDAVNYIRNVNNILRRNRRVLEEILDGTDKAFLAKTALTDKGYNFKFFTTIYINKDKLQYHYCYEYGYALIEEGICMVVRSKRFDLQADADKKAVS